MLIYLRLPTDLPSGNDAVVPYHYTPGYLLMHLFYKVSYPFHQLTEISDLGLKVQQVAVKTIIFAYSY